MSTQRGVTLIEAVLYISISLSLIVGGMAFFQQSVTASRSSQQVRQFSSMYSEIASILLRSGWKPVHEATDTETLSINSVLISSGAINSELHAGKLQDVTDPSFLTAASLNWASDADAIWTAWKTPSFWRIESAESVNARTLAGLQAAWATFNETTRQNLTPTLAELQQPTDEFSMSYYVLDLEVDACVRFLNGALNAPLNSNVADFVSGANSAYLAGPTFSPSEISDFCATAGANEHSWLTITWRAASF